MATRFYLASAGSAGIGPAFDASWEGTTGALRRLMLTSKRDSAMADVTVTKSSGANPGDILTVQYISLPIVAATITGTVKGVIRAIESSTSNDARAQVLIKVISYDGATVRGTLLAHSAAALSNEFSATDQENRAFPVNSIAVPPSLSSVVAQQGDRILIEIGARYHVATTAITHTLRLGDASSTDLAENETGTLDDNPWIEFSQTLTFLEEFTAFRGQSDNGQSLGVGDEMYFVSSANLLDQDHRLEIDANDHNSSARALDEPRRLTIDANDHESEVRGITNNAIVSPAWALDPEKERQYGDGPSLGQLSPHRSAVRRYKLQAQDLGSLPSIEYVTWVSELPSLTSYKGPLPGGGPIVNLEILDSWVVESYNY